MTTLCTTQTLVVTPSDLTIAGKLGPLYAPTGSNLDDDSREMLSILGRALFFLSLGTVAVVAVTGQLPLFFLPLGLFLFFGSVLQWRQPHTTRVRTTRQNYERFAMATKGAPNEPRTRYTDGA